MAAHYVTFMYCYRERFLFIQMNTGICILQPNYYYHYNHFTAIFPRLPGEPVPEETFTHSPILVIIQPYQLLPSTTIHSILRVQFIL